MMKASDVSLYCLDPTNLQEDAEVNHLLKKIITLHLKRKECIFYLHL